MNKSSVLSRQKAVAAAIGSVAAEGLRVSAGTKDQLQRYAEGTVTIDQIRQTILQNANKKLSNRS